MELIRTLAGIIVVAVYWGLILGRVTYNALPWVASFVADFSDIVREAMVDLGWRNEEHGN